VSGGGETGSRRWRSGAMQHAAAMRTRQRGRGGASRGDAGMDSWFKNGWKTATIREEGESGNF
jgi:hypothetical protein